MSSPTTSLHSLYQLPCLQAFMSIILFTIFYVTLVSSSPTPPSNYTLHCSTILPEPNPTSLQFTDSSSFPHFQNGYYLGGDRILSRYSPSHSSGFFKSVRFRTGSVHNTSVEGVFKVKGIVTIQNPYMQWYNSPMVPRNSRISSLRFTLDGFWSESSGRLCMVGSGLTFSDEGKVLNNSLGAVLKLNYVKNSSIFTSLVSGVLESTSSSADDLSYFEPISILGFTQLNYNYTLVSEEFGDGCSGGSEVPQSLPLSSQPHMGLCSMLPRSMNGFELKYASDCDSAKNCTPFGGDIGYLPRFMSLSTIQCSRDNQRLRVLVEFSNNSYVEYSQTFNPNMTLVGEGLWDGKKNQLCVVACQILNMTDSLANPHVGNCSIRLSLRFPAVWSIRDRSSIVGKIWSNKNANDSGYFKRIMYRSSETDMVGVPGVKYEYTQIDREPKSCREKKPAKSKGGSYPNGNSHDMRFDMSVKNSKGRIAWGYSVPLSVGNQFYEQYYSLDNQFYEQYNSLDTSFSSSTVLTNSEVEASTSHGNLVNISYKIGFTQLYGVKLDQGISLFNISSSMDGRVEISAEGIYDAETGSLCMVGCRNLGSNDGTSTSDSMDCEILVNFQFPASNSKKNGGYIKGSIKSTRKQSDSLYFEPLELTSMACDTLESRKSLLRMDLEITMVLISKTLACIFVGLQLFYVKKHPDMLPFTSVFMLSILTLGYMIPLMLNFEALFLHNRNQQNVLLGSGGWVEVNEVIVRVVTMVAFLLQFRLLQLTWSTQSSDGSQKHFWASEKKALFVSLPLYVAGGLISMLVNWRGNDNGAVMVVGNYQGHSLNWEDLKSYGGLVLDGFLLPQILLNMFTNLRDKPLSCSFYIGTTLVRLLPHAYDLYRAHRYVRCFGGSYFYANPGADFYSTAWDVIIPCGGLLFATIIYLQQRFGGRCILPLRFRQQEEYEKVPVVSNE